MGKLSFDPEFGVLKSARTPTSSSPGPKGHWREVPKPVRPNCSGIGRVEGEGETRTPPSPHLGAAGPLVSSPRLPRSAARRAAARLVPGKCGPESAARGEAWRGGWAPRTSGSRAQWLEGGRTPPARPARPLSPPPLRSPPPPPPAALPAPDPAPTPRRLLKKRAGVVRGGRSEPE